MRGSIILNWVRGIDIFAVPVLLTYKGQKAFNTLLGGFFTLFLIVSFLSYSGIQLYEMIAYPDQWSTTEASYFSYQDNNIRQNMNTKNSTLAVWVQGLNSTGYPLKDDETSKDFRIQFYQ